jgi:2-phospho-L-lactate guanylyltransferase
MLRADPRNVVMPVHRLFAIVPVKPLHEGKSRLSPILSVDERRQLNAFLMRRSFDLLAAFPGITQSIAISGDDAVAAEAKARGIAFLNDEVRDLNAALGTATRTAMAQGATAILVLPVDLPLATSDTLKRIVPREDVGNVCLIVPDRRRTGTNMLYVSPPRDDIFRFGPGSLELHREAAAALGYQTQIVDEPDLSLDIDEPDDYESWRRSPAGSSLQR